MSSSCALAVTRGFSLAAVLRPSAAAATASAAFGRSGAFGARWHLHRHAIVSSRSVQSRASARSQALDATCVSRKRHQVHGDASFCAERKIPTNIAGIPPQKCARVSRANAQEARRASTDRHISSAASDASALWANRRSNSICPYSPQRAACLLAGVNASAAMWSVQPPQSPALCLRP